MSTEQGLVSSIERCVMLHSGGSSPIYSKNNSKVHCHGGCSHCLSGVGCLSMVEEAFTPDIEENGLHKIQAEKSQSLIQLC